MKNEISNTKETFCWKVTCRMVVHCRKYFRPISLFLFTTAKIPLITRNRNKTVYISLLVRLIIANIYYGLQKDD